MDLHRWWEGDASERFWVEITGRENLGEDLRAPAVDDGGNENWTYDLIREVDDGDIVFHYEIDEKAIRSWSLAQGGFWEAEVLWGTPRSTGPSGAPVDPYLRPGLWHGLEGPYPLPQPVTLEDLRESEGELDTVRQLLEDTHGGPLYLPVQFRGDGLRGAQGYLAKMPAGFLEVLPSLRSLMDFEPPDQVGTPREEGEEDLAYEPANEDATRAATDPFAVDPDVVDRGTRSHSRLQNMLAEHIESAGIRPLRPAPRGLRCDLRWREGDRLTICEVKSLTSSNEERQLRYGLGQLHRYLHRSRAMEAEVRGVLFVEYRPSDDEWLSLCEELGIILLWPDALDERLVLTRRRSR